MSSRSATALFVERLQSAGRYTFTRVEAESQMQRSFIATQTALRRLKQQCRVVSPRRGFYVTVPPEYRAAGSPPASWFIDDLMRYLGQPYYVGLLSAAAIHGAAHQQPMVFQVVTSRPTREMRAGKLAIRFSMSGLVETLPVIEQQTETGTMRVAAPETCAFDLGALFTNARKDATSTTSGSRSARASRARTSSSSASGATWITRARSCRAPSSRPTSRPSWRARCSSRISGCWFRPRSGTTPREQPRW